MSQWPSLRKGLIGLSIFLGLLLFSTNTLQAEKSNIEANEKPLKLVTFGDHPPYHSSDYKGRLFGFDVDLAYAIAERIGRPVEIELLPEDKVIDAVITGQSDAVLGITESERGKHIFDYSTPYLNHKTRLFIRESTDFIHSLADLRGLRIGIRKGIDVKDYLRIVPGLHLVPEPSAEFGLRNLMNAMTSVYMGDEYECDYIIQKDQLNGITTVGGAFLLRRRAIAVNKGNEALLNEINRALEEIRKDFTMQRLMDEWLMRRIAWSSTGKWSMYLLLGILSIVATILMVTVVWNKKLSDAVEERTREVQSEHEHFENIFEHASDGIVVLDPKTCHVIQANTAFADTLEYKPEELAKVSLNEIDASEDRNFANQIHRAFSSGENVLFEARLFNKSQEFVDFFVHAKAFPYKGKQMVEAITRDITQRKRLEAMKDTILQDVAHELKTPIAKLSMSIELLEKKIPTEQTDIYAKNFDVCNRSIVRLQNTIEGILNLSRMESHTAKINMKEHVVQDVIQGVVQELKMFADRKKVSLISHLPKDPISIMCDSEMIRRLYINLIHNAIKFTENGDVNVRAEDDDQFVRISVKDSGIGLEKEDLTKIFGRFFQKSAAYEGSGVGLTISQKIVAFHSGVIWAESDGVGKGTTMHTLFPLSNPNNNQNK